MTQRKRIELRAPDWIYTRLKEGADYNGQTLNSYILSILREELDKGHTDTTEEIPA